MRNEGGQCLDSLPGGLHVLPAEEEGERGGITEGDGGVTLEAGKVWRGVSAAAHKKDEEESRIASKPLCVSKSQASEPEGPPSTAMGEMVNAWFAERVHTIQSSTSKENSSQQRIHQSSTEFSHFSATTVLPPTLTLLDNRCPSPASIPSPAPGTPTRKISASEFDRPLRPIVVKDSEGSLTFLSDSEREALPVLGSVMGEGGVTGKGNTGGDRCARLLELVKEVSSHLDVPALCHKIFLHINELIAADRYSLFLVGEDSSNRKFLVSRLFDVAEGSTLEESSSSCIRLEWNKGIVGHVAATGQPLNIKNAYQTACEAKRRTCVT
ncbi:cGMP-specific 3',5'-cyclic phosphodiesterase [Oryzias melastigma]|uniref:cGMP-specific 3',5'-cyclic phosphodiesterase n=1 Tax=Oryzias melastigma TaxID=30732 RepID=A0A834BQN9_ORYME|nr:cGMP-specific 3',5'-cyclic phosphodiesterase [Oryzias melastigma]